MKSHVRERTSHFVADISPVYMPRRKIVLPLIEKLEHHATTLLSTIDQNRTHYLGAATPDLGVHFI